MPPLPPPTPNQPTWVRGAVIALIVLVAAFLLVYGARLFVGIALIVLAFWGLTKLVDLYRRP